DPGRIRQAEWTKSRLPDTAPACVHDEGSRRLVLSGLNHTTFDLAVYASQDGSPHHHARLASGCWSSFARRDSYPQGFSERFQSSSLFLLPKAYLTQGHLTYFFGVRYGAPGTRYGVPGTMLHLMRPASALVIFRRWPRAGVGCYSSLGFRAPHAFPTHERRLDGLSSRSSG